MPPEREPQDHELTGSAIIRMSGDSPPVYLSRLCACGCGRTVNVVMVKGESQGRFVGQPVQFIQGHNRRIKEPYVIDHVTGCWVWIASLDKDGYGWSYRDGKRWRAHRDYWERYRGPIPEGLTLDHRCPHGPNRACVNPWHLEPCTNLENVMGGWERRWARREEETNAN